MAQAHAARSLVLSDGIQLDLEGHRLHIDGRQFNLTLDGFRLLHYLVQRRGHAVSADELVQAGILLPGQRDRYRAAVFELRRQMDSAGSLITSVRGRGYRFDAPRLASSALAEPYSAGAAPREA